MELALADLGMLLILLGFGLAFLGSVLLALSARGAGGRKAKVGGFVMIGPVPIVFGSDRKWIGAAAILFLAFAFLVFILMGGVGI
ncbi:MAG: DUF131 domain-containing protein [Candidatus Brockarchaeota archaeon]|nr:DUF131 domain-containing protein [Candidatus Brockarchaeota archaeon]